MLPCCGLGFALLKLAPAPKNPPPAGAGFVAPKRPPPVGGFAGFPPNKDELFWEGGLLPKRFPKKLEPPPAPAGLDAGLFPNKPPPPKELGWAWERLGLN